MNYILARSVIDNFCDICWAAVPIEDAVYLADSAVFTGDWIVYSHCVKCYDRHHKKLGNKRVEHSVVADLLIVYQITES
jgi:hypothetical protein